ncbi:MAG: DUF2141 domain-containing protein [Congregibacter sp.]
MLPSRYKSSGVSVFIALVAAMLTALSSAPTRAEQLTIDVTGLTKVAGALMVAVHNSEDSWDDRGEAAALARQNVTANTAQLVFVDLAPGTYAVMLYHDENANGELDTNMLGVPSEGYGFSNNKGRFGRPSFDEAKIFLTGDLRIEIKIL